MTNRLYLVRHGAYSGSNLTERGKHSIAEAAETIARDTKGAKVRIVASDVTRAIESANIIANKLGVKNVDAGNGFLYSGGKSDLRSYLAGCQDEVVILVGHEPFMDNLGYGMNTGQVRKLDAALNENTLERVALKYIPTEEEKQRKLALRPTFKERLEEMVEGVRDSRMVEALVDDLRTVGGAIANVGMIATWVGGMAASVAAGYTMNPMYAVAAVAAPATTGTLAFASERLDTIASIDAVGETAAECGKVTAANYAWNAILFAAGCAARRFA
ncbi:MAG: histidine phosphatase family protein [archaeon]